MKFRFNVVLKKQTNKMYLFVEISKIVVETKIKMIQPLKKVKYIEVVKFRSL